MFFVSDTQTQRHSKIRSFLIKGQDSIAVILAAVDFEWTVRRAILSLGTRATKEIRKSLETIYGLDSYKEIWNLEVKPRMSTTIVIVIPGWHGVTEAFKFRNRLVHGVVGAIARKNAENSVNSLLQASQDLEVFCGRHGGTLYRRIVRRKARGEAQ